MLEVLPPKQRLVSALPEWTGHTHASTHAVIGILRGEGIGPEVVDVTMGILDLVAKCTCENFDIRIGGKIGLPAQAESGRPLTPEVIDFCQSIFEERGALFCGPGGGRFVYDLRAHFDLYCKFTPIRPAPALRNVGVLKPEAVSNVDVIVVRENTGGLYFGDGAMAGEAEKSARHTFGYTEAQVHRILEAAIRLAQMRRGKLSVILKPGGIPSISKLWMGKLDELAARAAIQPEVLEVDNAVYQLIANASRFDVVVAPNAFGDILSDGARLLLGSRGLSHSGNFGVAGCAVYQTGHGAAHDLAGTNRANPIGQILSLAMMLRESFCLQEAAEAIETAIEETLRAGWRTADIVEAGSRVVGTKEMGVLIARQLEVALESRTTRT